MTDYSDLPEVDLGGGTATASEDDILEAMKDVVDPELGINVVDLGLVYGVNLDAESNLTVGSSRVDLQACKLEYSIVSPK